MRVEEPYGIVVAALLGGWAALGVIMGLRASQKGYSFAAWFMSGGIGPISFLILNRLPATRSLDSADGQRDHARQRGDQVGLIVSACAVLGGFAAIFVALLTYWAMNSDGPFGNSFITSFYTPVIYFYTGLEFLTLTTILIAYCVRHGRRSVWITAALAALAACTLAQLMLMEAVQMIGFEVPVELQIVSQLAVSTLHFAAVVVVCLTVVAAPRAPSDELSGA